MFGDLGKLMKVMGQLKTKLPEMREKMSTSLFVGEAGGGAVTATVNGKLALVELTIRPDLPDELSADGALDAEMLSDLVKAAVSAAQAQAVQAVQQAMSELTGGMPLPGLDGMLP